MGNDEVNGPARFSLQSDRDWSCPEILESRMTFETWPLRSSGSVTLAHRVQEDGAAPEVLIDTATFIRRDRILEMRGDAGWEVSFILDEKGTRLTSSNANCYPGQRGLVPDIGREDLVYQLDESVGQH